jgi:hypothetical protein
MNQRSLYYFTFSEFYFAAIILGFLGDCLFNISFVLLHMWDGLQTTYTYTER